MPNAVSVMASIQIESQVCHIVCEVKSKFVNLFQMGTFSVKRVAADGNSLFWSCSVLLVNASYYFVLNYLIANAETVLCCAQCHL
jgi:hypothetical protein